MALTKIFHREEGKGPVLVLIHGFCETLHIWDEFAKLLSNRFRMVMPDLPGFGKSESPGSSFSIAQAASSMTNWLSGLPYKNPVVIGHSLGGYVTLAMAREKPEQIAGFGLFHSTAKSDTEEKKLVRNKSIEFVIKNGVAPYIETFVPGLFYKKDSPAIQQVLQISKQTKKETLIGYLAAMRDRPDQIRVLSEFERPVLILAGEKDELIPLSSLEDQAILPKKPQFSTLANTGHMGMYEDSVNSARIVAQFVQNCQ